jgi:hypothetical protein
VEREKMKTAAQQADGECMWWKNGRWRRLSESEGAGEERGKNMDWIDVLAEKSQQQLLTCVSLVSSAVSFSPGIPMAG